AIPYRGQIGNDLTAIESLRYRVDDLTDSVNIKAWTDVSEPGSQGAIVIPASLNGMTRQYRDKELRQVTLEYTFADGTVQQKLAFYELYAVFIGALAND